MSTSLVGFYFKFMSCYAIFCPNARLHHTNQIKSSIVDPYLPHPHPHTAKVNYHYRQLINLIKITCNNSEIQYFLSKMIIHYSSMIINNRHINSY